MIKLFDKVYITIDGIDYFGYKGVFDDGTNWYHKRLNSSAPIVTRGIIRRFDESNIDKYLDDSFVLKDNDPIHVVPDCVYNIKDIRNNYQIKRSFDDGVCNVYSPIKYSGDNTVQVSYTIVVVPKKTVVFLQSCNSENEAKTYVREYFNEHFADDELIITNALHWIVGSRKIQPYLPILLGTAKKPCVSYKKINFNTNELTTDTLTIMQKAGVQQYNQPDAEENFLIQLAVLNQHNWREYPLTVRAVFNTMNRYDCIMYKVFSHPSKYPKYVNEMNELRRKSIINVNQKDVEMARKFYSELLGLTGKTMFVDTVTLHDKLEQERINLYDFCKVFDLMTRITPNEFLLKKYDA